MANLAAHSMPAKPGFFIVGAPKSGTTALTRYLDLHPELCIKNIGGVHFATDLECRTHRLSREEYLASFQEVCDAQKVGEACVWYLYSTSAAREIADYNPEAKIIIMLRNPVTMIPSQHSEFLYNRNEDIEDLAAALEAEADRSNGSRLPPQVHFPSGLQYREVASYGVQVKRYYDAFKPENVLVILFDDFGKDTAGCYKSVCKFLGVDPAFQPEFPVINANKRVRSERLGQLMKSENLLKRMVRQVLPQGARARLARLLLQANTNYTDRKPISPLLRSQLADHFREDVTLLSRLIGRDLSAWLVGE